MFSPNTTKQLLNGTLYELPESDAEEEEEEEVVGDVLNEDGIELHVKTSPMRFKLDDVLTSKYHTSPTKNNQKQKQKQVVTLSANVTNAVMNPPVGNQSTTMPPAPSSPSRISRLGQYFQSKTNSPGRVYNADTVINNKTVPKSPKSPKKSIFNFFSGSADYKVSVDSESMESTTQPKEERLAAAGANNTMVLTSPPVSIAPIITNSNVSQLSTPLYSNTSTAVVSNNATVVSSPNVVNYNIDRPLPPLPNSQLKE